MEKSKTTKYIIGLVCVTLIGCATQNPSKVVEQGDSKYPIIKKNGKKYRLIPAEDYLMRKTVPVPPAPNNEAVSIQVSLSDQRVWLYQYGLLTYTSPTCPGKVGHETPTGEFHVISKHKDWISTLYHVPMPFLLRLNAMNGEIGIHQGPIALEAASHGCIRLPKDMASKFFEVTPVGAKVYITNLPTEVFEPIAQPTPAAPETI